MDTKPTYEELEERIRILEKTGSNQIGIDAAFKEPKHFPDAMDRIDNAIQASENVEQMLDMVIEQVRQIFRCDRAWLFYPCNPNANIFNVTKESTHPDYPGAKALEMEVPMTADMAGYCTRALAAQGQVVVDPPDGQEMSNDIAIQFHVKTLIIMSLHPKVDDAWMFGLHQCEHHRIWTNAEKKLFRRIGYRINDALGSMLYLRQLQDSEKRYRSLFENAQDAIYLIDLETSEIVDCNQKALEMDGYAYEELTKLTLPELHPEHERQSLNKIINTILENGFYENIKGIHHLRKDGSIIPIEVNTRLIEIKGRKIGLSHARDVSERVRAEQALRESEIKFSTLFFFNPAGIVITTLNDGKIIDVNDSILEVTGYNKQEFLGHTSVDIGFWQAPSDWEKITRLLKENGHFQNLEFGYIRKSGESGIGLFSAEIVNLNNQQCIIAAMFDITERRRAEKAVLNSERKWRYILTNTPQIGISLDPEARIVFANEHFLKLTGWKEHEVIGQNWFDLFIPEQIREEVRHVFLTTMTHKDPLGYSTYENEIMTKDGELLNIAWSNVLTKDVQGNVVDVTCLGVDLTERKHAERALRESEEKYRKLFNEAQVAMFRTRISDGELLEVNGRYAEMAGYSSIEECLANFNPGRSWAVPKEREELLEILQKEGAVKDYETKIIRSDGTPIWINFSAAFYPEEGYLEGSIEDITDRKKAQESVREAYSIINRSPAVAFLWKNVDGWPVEYVSENVNQLFNYTAEEFISGKASYLKIIHPDDLERVATEVATYSDEKGREDFDHEPYRIITKNGEIKWVDDMTFIRQDEKGEISHYEGIVLDISKRMKIEEEKERLMDQLQQSQKIEAIGTLAGGIAHDFNNILSPIMIHSEMLMKDLQKDHPFQFNLKEIIKASERARDLVKQILAFGRKEEGKRITIKIIPILKETLKMLRASIPTTIEFQQHFETESDTVFADPTQIHQIILNLCTNAAHSMRDRGGILKVRVVESNLDSKSAALYSGINPGFYVKLSVSDTGTGINDETMHRIFEPYFTTKKHGEGTGMGLAMVHGIVKSYGGDITVQSNLGQGTSFDILLPRIVSDAPLVEKTSIQYAKGNERILFIDDEKAATDSIAPMLETLGYKVASRTSSIEALEAFRNNPEAFDLVITDMTMPNMTGKELSKALLSIRPDIPIILCTGYSEQINEEQAKEIGIKAFVMKPIVMREMAKTIRKLLD